MALVLDHSWREPMPRLSVGQLAELLPVLASWYREEFTPRHLPKVSQKVASRPKPKVDKGSQSLGRTLVYARSGGACEAALLGWCGIRAAEWHHRKARSLGGRWDASNGMHLCRYCHAWITENPAGAAERGWYLTARQESSAVPVKRFGQWALLDDEGGFEPVESEVA